MIAEKAAVHLRSEKMWIPDTSGFAGTTSINGSACAADSRRFRWARIPFTYDP
jgi:hypothetical protein